jgi:hypothetical protein
MRALLTQLFCGSGPTLAIELKPKMGHCLADESVGGAATALCNFCLKQFYKFQQGITTSLR